MLVEAVRVLAPEAVRAVRGRVGVERRRAHFDRELLERAHVLHGLGELLREPLEVLGKLLVVQLARLDQLQLLRHAPLHHLDRVVLHQLKRRHLLQQVLHRSGHKRIPNLSIFVWITFLCENTRNVPGITPR